MLGSLKKIRKDNAGATIIEFAIVAPVLFLLIFGTIDFGLLMSTHSILEGSTAAAARDYKAWARADSAGVAPSEIKKCILGRTSGMQNIPAGGSACDGTGGAGWNLIDPSLLRVTARQINWGGAQGCPPSGCKTVAQGGSAASQGWSGTTGDVMQYQVKYDYYFKTPLIAQLFPSNNGAFVIQTSLVVQNEPDMN